MTWTVYVFVLFKNSFANLFICWRKRKLYFNLAYIRSIFFRQSKPWHSSNSKDPSYEINEITRKLQKTSRPENSWQMNAKICKIQQKSVSTSAFLSLQTRQDVVITTLIERSTEASYPGLHGLAKVWDHWSNACLGFCISSAFSTYASLASLEFKRTCISIQISNTRN